MSEVRADFKADKSKFFKFYIQLLNPLLKLTAREINVLSSMLLIYYSNRNNPKIDELLFSTETRKVLRASLNLSEPSLNNSFMILRKKELIKDNKLNKVLLKFPENNKLTISYGLELIKEES